MFALRRVHGQGRPKITRFLTLGHSLSLLEASLVRIDAPELKKLCFGHGQRLQQILPQLGEFGSTFTHSPGEV